MTLYFEEEGEITLPLKCREIAKKVVETALDVLNCPYEAQVSLLLTMNAQIQEMNREFRGMDKPTDVLSFPMIEYTEPGEFDFLEERDDCFDPETGELALGDIVISKEKVIAQAEEYGHSQLEGPTTPRALYIPSSTWPGTTIWKRPGVVPWRRSRMKSWMS